MAEGQGRCGGNVCSAAVRYIPHLIAVAFFLIWWIIFSTAVRPAQRAFSICDESISRPNLTSIFNGNYIPILALIALVGFFLLMPVRRYWQGEKWYTATIIFFYGLLLANCLTGSTANLFKVSVGGLRPNFLAVCKPTIPAGLTCDLPYPQNAIYFNQTCTGADADVDDSRSSFPSGHAAYSFTNMVYLCLYIFLTLGSYHSEEQIADPMLGDSRFSAWGLASWRGRPWAFGMIIPPMLFACWISFTRLIDNHHFLIDLIVGAAIGTLYAFVAFAIQYPLVDACVGCCHTRPPPRPKSYDRHSILPSDDVEAAKGTAKAASSHGSSSAEGAGSTGSAGSTPKKGAAKKAAKKASASKKKATQATKAADVSGDISVVEEGAEAAEEGKSEAGASSQE